MEQRGFTLIELLLGLIVSGILAHLATPNFMGLLESQQQQSAAQSLTNGLRFARTEAITRNRAVVIHALDDDWSQGWRVVLDVSGRGHLDDDNPVLLERQGSGRVAIVGNGPVKSQVRFSGLGEPVFSGGGFRAGTVHVCATDQRGHHKLGLFLLDLGDGRTEVRHIQGEETALQNLAATFGDVVGQPLGSDLAVVVISGQHISRFAPLLERDFHNRFHRLCWGRACAHNIAVTHTAFVQHVIEVQRIGTVKSLANRFA